MAKQNLPSVAPPASDDKKDAAEEEAEAAQKPAGPEPMTMLEFICKGGTLMWPIGFFSLLVVAVGIERFVMLNARFIAPRRLFDQVDALAIQKSDPRKIYNLCRQHPSASATIIQAALMKVGRPMAEVQAGIQEAKDNEAERLFGNVRILVLAATVTPLIGLLGTVIGMIVSFRKTAEMNAATVIGANKAEQLSEGIYIALITTWAALTVSIPAAILAHWYEGKIQRIFRGIDRKLMRFVVYLTEVEGKVHVTPEQYEAFYEASKVRSHAPAGVQDTINELKIPAEVQKSEGRKKP